MMEQDFRSLLKADASVAGLATAVEWNEVRQGTLPPYVILEKAFAARDKHMGGPQSTITTRVRAKSFHTKAIDGYTLKEYLIAACDAATGVTQGGTRFLGVFASELGSLQVDTDGGIRNCEIVDFDVIHTIP